MRDLPDPEALELWLRELPTFEAASVGGISLAEGGASNLTCRAEITGSPYQALAIRVQQDDGIFAPYDVLLEGEVIRRLGNSPLPVPDIIDLEPDPDILGGPFIAMEWIDAPHMGVAGDQADYTAYVEAVVSVHATDWRGLGLDCLGVPEDAAAATLAQLDRMVARMERFGCQDDVDLGKAVHSLRKNVPEDGSVDFCQGDINVFNYLFRDRKVIGIVDWEEAFLGDCRADMGQLIALSHLKGEPWCAAEESGFAKAYCQLTDHAAARLGYFRSLWFFYLAVIWHGWTRLGGGEPWYSLDQVMSALDRSSSDF